MTVDIEDHAGVKVVRIRGDFIGGQGPNFVELVTGLYTGPGVRVVIDLSEVPYLNSTALGELVRVTAQANIQEGRVILARPSAFVTGVLQTSQLDRFFEVCPTLEEAVDRMK